MRSGSNFVVPVLVGISFVLSSGRVIGQSTAETPNVAVISAELLPPYLLLMRQSASFRAAIEELETSGFKVLIGYHDDFEQSYPLPVLGALAQVKPLLREGRPDRFYGVHIVFYTREIAAIARAAGVANETITRELAIVLAHELYGHVVPAALAGTYPSPCADPVWDVAGEEKGCAVERENRIRNEIGSAERLRYRHVDLSFFCVSNEATCRSVNEGDAPRRAVTGQRQ